MSTVNERQQERNSHWSEVASQYSETWRNPSPEGQLYKDLEASLLVEFTKAGPGQQILDLCCGTGRNSLALARTGAHVVGIDGAYGMIEQARRNADEEGIDNVEFIQGDSRCLPFDDNRFDAVVGICSEITSASSNRLK